MAREEKKKVKELKKEEKKKAKLEKKSKFDGDDKFVPPLVLQCINYLQENGRLLT
jgi:hypothetical protein